ncbi:HEAT repeat domain-containing protein [uncultured Serinicoccus sp.]|uniref:HEAT repeat domain-containing protein n=1 Tax=uncultured Serinicoccus sp. TaxID=735514 RepID=UPI00263728A6|nr:HEAT repeat domain-containing protein [uncultured Serinicoccus sp.]
MSTLEQARRAVYDVDPTVRQKAAVHLGTHGDESLTPELVALLVAEPDFFVRETLTWAVVRHPEAALPHLVEALDGAPEARVQVLHALSKVQAPEAVPHILPFADDADPRVAMKAWWALGRTGTPEAAPALLPHLGRGGEEQQRELARAFEQLGAPGVPGLAEAVADGDAAVRRHAAQTLVLVGDPASRPAAPALAAMAETDEKDNALVALEALAALDEPCVGPALERLRDGEDRFRSMTAQWLLADRAERGLGGATQGG